MDAGYRIRRFSTSRGFWPTARQPACAGDDGELRRGGQAHTIRQRVAACGSGSVVLHEREDLDPHTGELVISRRFVGRVPLSLDALRLRLGECGCDDPNSLVVAEPAKVRRLFELCRVNRPAHASHSACPVNSS